MGVDDDPAGNSVTSENHDSAGGRRWWRRRWLWATGGAVVVIAVATIAIPQILQPDDPAEDGALPSDIGYGLPSWTPRGSLADDAGFIRDGAKRLPERDDDGDKYYLLWAGHGTNGADGESDFAYFASYTGDKSGILEFFLVHRYPDGHWSDDGPQSYSEQAPGSFRNSVIPLPLDAVEGLSGDNEDYFLVSDDVAAGGIAALGGDRLREHDGVVGANSDVFGHYGMYNFTVRTPSGKAYTSPYLTEPLEAEDWTQAQAKAVLEFLPTTSDGASVALADDGALTELRRPEALKFDGGIGFGVQVVDHHFRYYEGIDPPNPGRQRSALIIAAPGHHPIVTGPALDGNGNETHPSLDADFAAAVPEGMPSGTAVAVSGGNAQAIPKLPVIGKPVKKGGPMVFGEAPESTAIVFHSEQGSPRSTSLVVQHPDR